MFSGPYIKVYYEDLKGLGLSILEKNLYCQIISFENGCYIKNEWFIENYEQSRSAIKRALDKLIKSKLIERTIKKNKRCLKGFNMNPQGVQYEPPRGSIWTPPYIKNTLKNILKNNSPNGECSPNGEINKKFILPNKIKKRKTLPKKVTTLPKRINKKLIEKKKRPIEERKKESLRVFNYWNNKGKPYKKHKHNTNIYKKAMNQISIILKQGTPYLKIKRTIDRYHELLKTPDTKFTRAPYKLNAEYAPANIDDFFHPSSYYKKLTNMTESWFEICRKKKLDELIEDYKVQNKADKTATSEEIELADCLMKEWKEKIGVLGNSRATFIKGAKHLLSYIRNNKNGSGVIWKYVGPIPKTQTEARKIKNYKPNAAIIAQLIIKALEDKKAYAHPGYLLNAHNDLKREMEKHA